MVSFRTRFARCSADAQPRVAGTQRSMRCEYAHGRKYRRTDDSLRQPRRNPDHVLLQHVLNDLQNEPSAWPFVKPVDKETVADYYDVITEPMGTWFAECKCGS